VIGALHPVIHAVIPNFIEELDHSGDGDPAMLTQPAVGALGAVA
jgi:hypothetical protein